MLISGLIDILSSHNCFSTCVEPYCMSSRQNFMGDPGAESRKLSESMCAQDRETSSRTSEHVATLYLAFT